MSSRYGWFNLTVDAMQLGLEAQTVIGLRLARAAAGGAAAETEARLMVTEKIMAGLELQRQLLALGLGPIGPGASAKAVAYYRRKVRANRRRLLREN